GEIAADADFENVVTMLMVIVDGMWWRRAVDPSFNPERVLPLFLGVTKHMLLGGGPGCSRQPTENLHEG
ncbi:MAG: hypothetical protein IT538_15445, partial [Variibacter sp.]|nr:hypothetical protein [Variibacter sp.]